MKRQNIPIIKLGQYARFVNKIKNIIFIKRLSNMIKYIQNNQPMIYNLQTKKVSIHYKDLLYLI